MESLVLKEAFSMWKIFDELVDTFLKPGSVDKSIIHKLANMVMSKEFSKTFLYNKEPGVTLNEYKGIVDKYHTFTVWLLQQFFYLLSCDNDEIIVDAQLSILDQLARTHLHVYSNVANEYCKALECLIDYLKNHTVISSTVIKIFNLKKNQELASKLNLKEIFIEIHSEKECINLIKRILKIVWFILSESVIFYSIDNYIYSILDNLLFLLKQRILEINIYEMFTDILQKLHYHLNDFNLEFLSKIRSFFSLFEQCVYNYINNKNPMKFNEKSFESLLQKYIQHCHLLTVQIGQNHNRISEFIIKYFLMAADKTIIPQDVIKICLENVDFTVHDVNTNINSIVVTMLQQNNPHLFNLIKLVIFEDIYNYFEDNLQLKEILVYNCSKIWLMFSTNLISSLDKFNCTPDNCELHQKGDFLFNVMESIVDILLSFKRKYKNTPCTLSFFKEEEIVYKIICNIVQHYTKCKDLVKPIRIFYSMSKLIVVTNCKNVDILYYIIACQFLVPLCYKSEVHLPTNFLGNVANIGKLKDNLKKLYYFIINDKSLQKSDMFQLVNEFLKWLSSGLVPNLNQNYIEQIETEHIKILKSLKESEDTLLMSQLSKNIPIVLNIFSNTEELAIGIFMPLLKNHQNISDILSDVLCTSSNNFYKIISSTDIKFVCEKCDLKYETIEALPIEEYVKDKSDGLLIKFPNNKVDLTPLKSPILKTVLHLVINANLEIKLKILDILPRILNHFSVFYTPDVTKIWIELVADHNREIRMKLANVISSIVKNGQFNSTIASNTKTKVLEIVSSTLMRVSKKSLQTSNYDLQNTLLHTLDQLGRIDNADIKLECFKIFLYFIMVPTSNQSFVALNKCMKLSERDAQGRMKLYRKNSRTISEIIAHLCYVNQHLNQSSLQESLFKVSVVLGYENVKEYLKKEAENLLPFLITKMVKNANVSKLVNEMANVVETDVSQLLSLNYGNIFLYLYLGDMNEAQSSTCMNFVEKMAKISGNKLRKKNFKVILNKLLLNFHEKRRQVLKILQLLLREDSTTQATSVEDYLQPFFLAFLLYFDLELSSDYSKKENILLSLADLLKFLGTNRIMPLRFKILATLQTSNYLKYPELTCIIWDSFIKTCEVECLGPHLATIFISMLPLIEQCPSEVNKLLQYLIVENEDTLKDYIPDLFFVNNPYLYSSIINVIKKHLRVIENMSLKDKIHRYLKYLKHDGLEVKLQSLKQLKHCLEQNREELDQMILGYNGIDSAIVELIDNLTLGCREKDKTLKLACGEVFGELGAIEPSHLPRRYAQFNNSFIFFISEDPFIESALTELIKAFQTDKNARNTDRVALAIQEILKNHDISPNESSSQNFMWKKFSESQREVMTPLLSSKYIYVEKYHKYSYPLYGSNAGASFQSWLYNWTSDLIMSLPDDRKSLLQNCFPSMKMDKKVLMHFLPYILLHSLLEGLDGIDDKSFTEFQTILNSFDRKKITDIQVLKNKPIRIRGLMATACEVTEEEEKQMKCTRVVFILLDFLDRWLREWHWCKGQNSETDQSYQKIKRFVKKFCKLELAKCNYKCGEYPRALMYLEDFLTENLQDISAHLPFLAEIYAQLDEPDGVLGVEPLQQAEPSLEQRILSLEVSGKLADAAAIYEHMPRPLKLQHVQGLIQCYLDLDKVNTALYFTEGAVDLQPEYSNMLQELQSEALWRLGKYDDLEQLLEKPDLQLQNSWAIQLGKSLIHIKKGERDLFKSTLESIKRQQVESFGSASIEEGAYHHGYSYITHLHCLSELEQIEKTLFQLYLKPNDKNYAERIMKKLSSEWQLRIKVVQTNIRNLEPLLCLRRVVLNLGRNIAEEKMPQAVPFFDELLGESWLQSVTVARNAGVLQQAYTYVLDAEKYNPPKLFIEKAKLHWMREEHEEALITLKRGLNCYIPDNANSQEVQQIVANLSLENKKLCAEARLLIATYNDTICSVDVDMNLQQYKESMDVYKEWEKSLVCLAQYQDRIFKNYAGDDRDIKGSELQLHIVNNFGKSLSYGTNYIYQSMPRLLSIWFDYGTRLAGVSNTNQREERRNFLVKMTKIIDGFLNKLPAFIFLTSFSQIISRISHPQKEVYVELKNIIIKLLQHYPQQCLWMISSVIKSSYPIRAKRCSEILDDPKLKIQTMSKLIKDFTSLAERLIELCNKEIPSDVNTTNVSMLVRSLPRMLTKGDFSEIMMPTHKFRKLILPNPDFKNSQHNPFPNHYVHIIGIEDEMSILTSLQRPRKINLRGSDGKNYTFMLKPKDDLRKDFRLMEFNDIVNHLLICDPEARQRRLNIRLYSVAPLNEECGLIEWVPNLLGLRPILMNLYKQRGLGMRPREIKEICCNIRDPIAKKREVFKNILLKKHPPVLGHWFRKTFPDAQTWLTARTGYIRTTAVISITGYILGLGDRHGENIQLDSTCGDVVHVDFNCLFNKGETFEWPERVPFRLTQNMVSAMGPLGVEGVFRKSCECTLRVLRSNTATLMSIVTPFVYDPLVSWPRNVPAAAQSSERVNEQALEHIKNIELRLQGKVKTRSRSLSQCLSVEGQAEYLIKEAMSTDNLCQMYIGWGPYL